MYRSNFVLRCRTSTSAKAMVDREPEDRDVCVTGCRAPTGSVAAEFDALLPAILDQAFIRLHAVMSRQEGEL